MARQQFPLSSDLLETLLAFEEARSLSALAEMMAKDPSVVSRNLQRIAEAAPVLSKVHGRWEITPLGRQINESTRKYLTETQSLLKTQSARPKSRLFDESNTLLVVINAQNGLLNPTLGNRNNQEAEENISKLLTLWRSKRRPILHVRHISENPHSVFYKNSKGCDFLPALAPSQDEWILEKKKSSAFTETVLNAALIERNLSTLVLTGYTANECIDATARDASGFGLSTFVVGDATAMFDISDTDGRLVKAEQVHRLTLANINALYAPVIRTQDLVQK